MGQHRGEYDLRGHSTKSGSSSGSLRWPLPGHKRPHQQCKSHGTASTQKKKKTVVKVANASVQNPPPLLCTILLNPTFSQGCGMTVKKVAGLRKSLNGFWKKQKTEPQTSGRLHEPFRWKRNLVNLIFSFRKFTETERAERDQEQIISIPVTSGCLRLLNCLAKI